MTVRFAENQKLVLIAIYRFIREGDGQVWIDVTDVEPLCPDNLSRSFIHLILERLEYDGLLEGQEESDGRFSRFMMTAEGVEAAEDAALEFNVFDQLDRSSAQPEEPLDLEQIDDERKNAVALLDQLDAALVTGNDVGSLSADEVSAAISEIRSLKSMVSGSRVRIQQLAARSRETLGWITKKATETMVSELAKAALKAILTFLGFKS